jgi:hypothetical protein
MEVGFPRMLMPFTVAAVLIFNSLLVYGTAMHLVVRVVLRLIRSGPLEAIDGLLLFGLSAGVLFAIMSQLIARRLRAETGHQNEAAGYQAP